MVDFRPISLCNVVYKLVSKVLANRLKLFLGDIVSENQSAFTPGRLITDNILVAFELFHFMKNSRNKNGHMALKLDMSKAYDRVEWHFLERVLLRMGFDSRWVNRVMMCVSSVTFSVLINGSPSEEFRPERGLRQGDPLSPYLFILCAEVLSSLVRRAAENGSLHGIRIAPTAPVVSHLFFADDSIFFIKAKLGEAICVQNILQEYAAASGEVINFDKTTVSFSRGTRETDRNLVTARLGVRTVEVQERYLGLPTVIGHSKRVVASVIRDKLCKKLQGWRGQLFSKAGREVLIKAVAQSIPTYAMSVFKLPANFCDELRSIVSRFWWGSTNGKSKIPWIAWSKLCQPKCMGGLGFRDFHMFNMALLGKQAWRLVTNKVSLMSRVMGGKYFPAGDFMSASMGTNPSYTWRGIIEAREVLFKGLRRRVGDGMSTKVWTDPWIANTQTRRVLSPRRDADANMMVADLWSPDGTSWDKDKVREYFLPFEYDRIVSMRISLTKPEDAWTWELEKNGEYSVKSAYRALTNGREDEGGPSDNSKDKALWNRIWKAKVLPRIKVFMWLLCNDAIATKYNLATRVRGFGAGCPVCENEVETSLHLIRGCGVAGGLWDRLGMEVRMADGEMGEEEGSTYTGEGNGSGRRQWVKPDGEVVKINVDAGVKEGWGSGLGVICRGNEGEVLWGLSEHREEMMEVRMAEAEAMVIGIQEARRRGYTKIAVESDCKPLVDALLTKEKGRSDFHLLLDDIFSVCDSFESVSWSFASRNLNRVAHELAKLSAIHSGRKLWDLGDLPRYVVDLVHFDSYGMN
ncbi:uncharacterized protein LOC141639286 [Silene latifolia]|uniref:uncharacterized protein LOC141639286 n=1 Tax=Silene latifolia TaxID=37657 RepID=UPI003D78224E